MILYEENKRLLKLDEWPSEKISVDMKDALLLDGCCFIDNTKFNFYINAFSDKKLILNLDEYVFQQRQNRHK